MENNPRMNIPCSAFFPLRIKRCRVKVIPVCPSSATCGPPLRPKSGIALIFWAAHSDLLAASSPSSSHEHPFLRSIHSRSYEFVGSVSPCVCVYRVIGNWFIIDSSIAESRKDNRWVVWVICGQKQKRADSSMPPPLCSKRDFTLRQTRAWTVY